MNRWISVKDDMPQPRKPVLVCVDGEVKKDVYEYGAWENTWESPSSGDWFRVKPDHFWMRFPDGTNDWRKSMEKAEKEFNQGQLARYTDMLA